MAHSRWGKTLLMVLVSLAITACGQKGPLYRVDEKSSADQLPASEKQEKKTRKPAVSQP